MLGFAGCFGLVGLLVWLVVLALLVWLVLLALLVSLVLLTFVVGLVGFVDIVGLVASNGSVSVVDSVALVSVVGVGVGGFVGLLCFCFDHFSLASFAGIACLVCFYFGWY